MIHLTEARKIIEVGLPVSICFWSSKGETILASNVICTSSNFHNNTINLKFLDSGEFRKIKCILIYKLNEMDVVL